jgi:hypothetical protein
MINVFFFLRPRAKLFRVDLVLNHPSGVKTLYFQKRATLAQSPPIPTTHHIPGRRPRRRAVPVTLKSIQNCRLSNSYLS